jgi:hypothetical protein
MPMPRHRPFCPAPHAAPRRLCALAAAVVLVSGVSASPTGAEEAAAAADWPDRPLSAATPVALPRHGPLTPAEEAMARIAWRYFENNYQPLTGLTNSTHNYPSVTLWDTGSYLAGLVSAHAFGFVANDEVETRLDRLFSTLENIQLFRDECPNKVYHTETARPVDYLNRPGEIGCSAIDIGRILIWLRVIEQRYPQYESSARRVVERWDFCGLVQEAQAAAAR